MAEPSSAKLLAPVQASSPERTHTTRLAPTLCVLTTTIPGEELVFVRTGGGVGVKGVLTRFQIQSVERRMG